MRRLIGVDVGGSAIKAGAVTEDGRMLERSGAPTGLEHGPEHVIDTIARIALDLGARTGVGIGFPGLVDRRRGLVSASPNLKSIEGVPLRDEIARRIGC